MGVTTPTQLLERRPRVRVHRNAKTTVHSRALLVRAGSTCMWRSMTTVAWPTPRCYGTNRRRRPWLLPSRRALVCRPRRSHRTRAHRQRQWVHRADLSRRRHARWHSARTDPAVSAADQWQSGAFDPDAATRVGLCDRVCTVGPSHRGARPVAQGLQHPTATRSARISATVLPFSESGPVNNLARNHT